jgi:hypothetical protein
MSEKPSPDEVRVRVRRMPTASLLLIVGGLMNADVSGPAPADAVARLEALGDEAAAELRRRGIVVAVNTGLTARMTYRGDAAGKPRTVRKEGFQA